MRSLLFLIFMPLKAVMDGEYEERVLPFLRRQQGWDDEYSISEFKHHLDEADLMEEKLELGWVLWHHSNHTTTSYFSSNTSHPCGLRPIFSYNFGQQLKWRGDIITSLPQTSRFLSANSERGFVGIGSNVWMICMMWTWM